MSTNSHDSTSALVAEMQEYYHRRASIYDASMRYDDPAVVALLEPIFDAVGDEMRDRAVLEIACGPAFWTQRVAKTARSIMATDYNDSTLAEARNKRWNRERVTFQRADAYDLSTIALTFSGAFAVDWLAHVPESRFHGFLRGLHQRLEPGARVAFCDQTPGPKSLTNVHDREGNHLQERALPDGSRYRVVKHFFSDDEYREKLRPYTDSVSIRRYADQRRVLVSYSLPPRVR